MFNIPPVNIDKTYYVFCLSRREIMEVSVQDKADVMSVENGTAVHARIFNVGDYHQADLF